MFNNLRLVYITTSSKEEAQKIGRRLVEERLTACVNIIGEMESIYRWHDEIKQETECVLIAKTTYHNVSKLTARVKELHSYECPCIISVPISEQEGNRDYQKWLIQEAR